MHFFAIFWNFPPKKKRKKSEENISTWPSKDMIFFCDFGENYRAFDVSGFQRLFFLFLNFVLLDHEPPSATGKP